MTQDHEQPLPKLLTQNQAAKFLGISHRTLENYRLTGAGPKYVRIGKRLVRYRKSDLLEFAGLVGEV